MRNAALFVEQAKGSFVTVSRETRALGRSGEGNDVAASIARSRVAHDAGSFLDEDLPAPDQELHRGRRPRDQDLEASRRSMVIDDKALGVRGEGGHATDRSDHDFCPVGQRNHRGVIRLLAGKYDC
jgi:hypothetical protein